MYTFEAITVLIRKKYNFCAVLKGTNLKEKSSKWDIYSNAFIY